MKADLHSGQLIPDAKLEEMPHLFKKWNTCFIGTTAIHKRLHNKNKSVDREFKLMRKRLRNVRKMENILKDKGLDFECQVINLPDIKQLRREEVKQNEANDQISKDRERVKTEAVSEMTKPLKINRKQVKPLAIESIDISKRVKIPKSERRKSVFSPKYPKLLKFSILLSANKKSVLYSKRK